VPKYQKITLLIFCGLLILGYNNCGKVQFSGASAGSDVTTTGAGGPTGPGTGSNPGGPSGGNPSGTPPPISVPITLNTLNQVAYEDLEDTSNPDYDYNDFLTEFVVNETVVNNNITDIYIDFYPRAVGAGDDHQFKLITTGTVTGSANNAPLPQTSPMFQGSAQVSLTYYDQNGKVTSTQSGVDYTKDIILFASTHGAFGQSANAGVINTRLPSGYTSGIPSNYIYAQQNVRVHIALSDPSSNPVPASGTFNSSLLRVILHNINTNIDIDIINVGTNNFVASTGFPWGFIIPTDWQWMQEGINIVNGYNPAYSQYAQYLDGTLSSSACNAENCQSWFNSPVSGSAASANLYPEIPFTAFLPAP
jgi:hypothetical protein